MLAATCPKGEDCYIKPRHALCMQICYLAPCQKCMCSAWHDKQSMVSGLIGHTAHFAMALIMHSITCRADLG